MSKNYKKIEMIVTEEGELILPFANVSFAREWERMKDDVGGFIHAVKPKEDVLWCKRERRE